MNIFNHLTARLAFISTCTFRVATKVIFPWQMNKEKCKQLNVVSWLTKCCRFILNSALWPRSQMGGWREAIIQSVHPPRVHRLHSGWFYSVFRSRLRMSQIATSKIDLRLRVSQDQHLHNFFEYCQSSAVAPQVPGGELVKYLKVKKPDGSGAKWWRQTVF